MGGIIKMYIMLLLYAVTMQSRWSFIQMFSVLKLLLKIIVKKGSRIRPIWL